MANMALELKERLEAQRHGCPMLVWRAADGRQRVLVLEEALRRVTIGRRPDCDVPLTDDVEVSRLHAVIEHVHSDWVLVDNGLSRNGTWVGEEPLHGRRRLIGGDVMRFGSTTVSFWSPATHSHLEATVSRRDNVEPREVTDVQRRILTALCRPYFTPGVAFPVPPTNKEIADEVFLSVDAVKGHLRRLFERFKITDVPQNEKRARLAERAILAGAVRDPGTQ